MSETLARRMAETLGRLRWSPHRPTPKQLAFLALDSKEALYGGAAGGGKSDALLMGGLEYVDVPGYAALLLRRTYAELSKSDGLIPRSHAWLANTAARWNDGLKQWTFPSGATLSFGYLDNPNDHYQYQSTAYQYVAFDELTHFRENQYRYLFSRVRRPKGFPVPLRVRAGSNPGGVGHAWVYKRFVRGPLPAGRSFIPATLDDNPHLDKEAYEANLEELDPVERARLRHGDWLVQREGLVYPGFEACVVDRIPEGLAGMGVGGLDFGWNNPFAAEWGLLDRDDVLWIVGERYAAKVEISRHAEHLPRSLRGAAGPPRWYADPAGADQIAELRLAGHDVIPSTHIGHQPLAFGIDLVNRRIRDGRLRVHASCSAIREEAGVHCYEEGKGSERPIDKDNHALAALRYLVTGLDRLKARAPEGDDAAEWPESTAVDSEAPEPDEDRDAWAWGDDDD